MLAPLAVLAVDPDRVVHYDPILVGRGSIYRVPLDTLFAQRLDHVVDVRLSDFGYGLHDLQRREIDEFYFRKDFEGRRELDIGTGINVEQLHRRRAHHGQFALAHCVLETGLHDFRGHLTTQGIAEAPLHFLERHLAPPESWQRHLARGAFEAIREAAFEIRRWHRYRHLAAQAACRLYRYVHVSRSIEDRPRAIASRGTVLGWMMGLEPTTTGSTIRGSTC